MQRFTNKWHPSLSILLALGISTSSVLPLIHSQPATAQLFPQRNRLRISAGTIIPTTYDDAERIILKQDESLDLTLVTTRSVRSSRGTVLIPRGSTIKGQLQPRGNGTQFVAEELIFRNGRRWDIDATSQVITRTETVRKGTNTDPIWQGALVGGAAATAISAGVTKVGPLKTLAGAGAGALAGWLVAGRNGDSTDVLVVEPDTDLNLTLDSDLFFRS